MEHESGRWPVSEVAARLGVSPRRVQAMIGDGLLDAVKIGGHWFVDAASLRQQAGLDRRAGRMFSSRNAWALLSLASELSGGPALRVEGLRPWSRAHLRRRLEKEGLFALAPRLRRRAAVRRLRIHPGGLARLATDPLLVRSGVSAAANYGIDILAPGVVEGYVRANHVPDLVHKYFLTGSPHPNVILHVVTEGWPFPPGLSVAPAPVTALDLLESEDQRCRRAGMGFLASLANRQLVA